MIKSFSLGLIAAGICSPASALASCGDLSKTFFGVEMAGPRNYLSSTPEGFSVDVNPNRNDDPTVPGIGGFDWLSGESHGLSHGAKVDWWRDRRVLRIQDHVPIVSPASFEDYLEIFSGIAGIPFEYDSSNDVFSLACEPALSVRACRESFATPARPRLILVIEHEDNDAMYRDALIGPDGTSLAPVPNAGRGDMPTCLPSPRFQRISIDEGTA